MQVFVTGASGWIGSATVRQLLASGHNVVGLARSPEAAAAVAAAGAEPLRADLDDLAALRTAASQSDGVVHLAFRHDVAFSGDFQAAAESDRRAIEAFGDALSGSDRPLLVAAGTLGLAPGRVGTEDDMPDPNAHPRIVNTYTALALAKQSVRSAVIRFAPTVHGQGDHGFVARLVNIAREKGVSGYVGEGNNRWPAVHRLDAATLVSLALEKAPAGAVLHATDEEGIATRLIAEAIGRQVNVPVVSIPVEEAGEHFGFLAGFLGVDAPASSQFTRDLLGWKPSQPGLLSDLDEGRYTNAGHA